MRITPFILVFILVNACTSSTQVDLIIHNAIIYTVDDSFSKAQAIAVNQGKIVAIGAEHQILNGYKGKQKIDAAGRYIYPGFIDAHSHFLGYGREKQRLNLTGTSSYKEVISRISEYIKEQNSEWILGRGWDQNDWEVKEFPTNDTLNKLFPNHYIALNRVDGHAVLASQNVLQLAGITSDTELVGGHVLVSNGVPTGILLGAAEDLIKSIIPAESKRFNLAALKIAQEDCFTHGLTTVCDAGLPQEDIELINESHNSFLKIRVYAMFSASNNLIGQLDELGFQSERLTANSIKLYVDGALGSRGAALLKPYSDDTLNYGLIITPEDSVIKWAKACFDSGMQLNAHCIGDSANRITLRAMGSVLQTTNDRRWRIEHAQVVDEEDQNKFGSFNILPSMQPTHATSDMYWAEERLGAKRINFTYSLKSLLQQNGLIALGTDFPIEEISPLKTFYAAAIRKDYSGFPEKGFRLSEALSREEALRGITIWSAVANFEDSVKGSLEIGKYADMVMLDQDLLNCSDQALKEVNVLKTWVNGELVFEK